MVINKYITWVVWVVVTAAIVVYLGQKMTGDDEGKEMFLIGETTHGHYQIEMACSACHTDSFGGKESLQNACINCHTEELKAADDSHPKSKFTDPRNASRVEILDARYCITCHQEHNKDITNNMGLTLQDDYCFKCHSDIAEERVSHKGLEFNSCSASGCHNYHDNTALYEDFLEKHLDEENINTHGTVPGRNLSEFMSATSGDTLKILTAADMDAPEEKRPGKYSVDKKYSIIQKWEATQHAKSGVNCTDCHRVSESDHSWTDIPGMKVCSSCHDKESSGFLDGKHGMRLKQGLSPMTPSMARLNMKQDSHDSELSCNSCHTAHDYNTSKAAFESCINCHDDGHSQAYEGSPHYSLWLREQYGMIEPGKGVSCATCHLPREKISHFGVERTLVQHNQNANLRPNEKMIRNVCMNCHGLEFSINALADEELVKRNFTGSPSVEIEGMGWVKDRVLERSKKHQSATQTGKE